MCWREKELESISSCTRQYILAVNINTLKENISQCIPFYNKMDQSGHGRWKEHRITFDENIHKCRLILSANFQTEWERRRHALNSVSVRTSNLMWQLLLYSEIQLGTFRGHNDCKRNWCGGQKNHAMSQSQRRHCSSEKSAPALQTALLFLGLLI